MNGTLVPADDAEVQIEATADTLKPVFSYADKLVDEFKLRVDSDGLRYDVVDPENVAMIGMEVPSDVYDGFDVDETVVGVDTGRFLEAMRAGRKNRNDPMTLSYSNHYATTQAHREYDGVEMDLRNRLATIDPDSIRQLPDPSKVDFTEVGTIPRKAVEDGVNVAGKVSKHLTLESDGSDLILSAAGDTDDTEAVASGVMDGEGARSTFSIDYFTDMLKSITSVGADDITVKMANELPVRVEWETEWNDATVTGYWFIAPRVQT